MHALHHRPLRRHPCSLYECFTQCERQGCASVVQRAHWRCTAAFPDGALSMLAYTNARPVVPYAGGAPLDAELVRAILAPADDAKLLTARLEVRDRV